MREIITIQLGGCGNSIGQQFWDVVSTEHAIDPCGYFYGTSALQLERINVYYNEANQRFFARAICADTDKGSIQALRSSVYGKRFNPEYLIYGNESTGCNFAKGYLTEGLQLMDKVLDMIRREAETVDSLQGFQIIHGLGGGTGSGMGALLLSNLASEYPDNIVSNFTIFPSPKVSNAIVEPYNCILGFPTLIAHSHNTFCIDNEALHDICIKTLNLPASSFADMNHIIAHVMSGITTCFRFPGQLNSGLQKILVNMVPFPNLHFFVAGFAPLTSCHKVPYMQKSVAELVMEIFSGRNLLTSVDMRRGKFLTSSAIFRGLMSTREVDELMKGVRKKNQDHFIPWIPNNIKIAICDIPPKGLKLSSTFIGNTTSIQHLFKRHLKAFEVMFKRKAYIHLFTGEGIDEIEFQEAANSVRDLLKDYAEYEKDVEEVDDRENVYKGTFGVGKLESATNLEILNFERYMYLKIGIKMVESFVVVKYFASCEAENEDR